VLVVLGAADARPEFYVVPRNVLSAYICVGHRAWLRATSKSGEPHQPNTMRDVEQRTVAYYKERWDLLDGPPVRSPTGYPTGL
jgi:hypothetical protein